MDFLDLGKVVLDRFEHQRFDLLGFGAGEGNDDLGPELRQAGILLPDWVRIFFWVIFFQPVTAEVPAATNSVTQEETAST